MLTPARKKTRKQRVPGGRGTPATSGSDRLTLFYSSADNPINGDYDFKIDSAELCQHFRRLPTIRLGLANAAFVSTTARLGAFVMQEHSPRVSAGGTSTGGGVMGIR